MFKKKLSALLRPEYLKEHLNEKLDQANARMSDALAKLKEQLAEKERRSKQRAS